MSVTSSLVKKPAPLIGATLYFAVFSLYNDNFPPHRGNGLNIKSSITKENQISHQNAFNCVRRNEIKPIPEHIMLDLDKSAFHL
jgi:hypothetical protein